MPLVLGDGSLRSPRKPQAPALDRQPDVHQLHELSGSEAVESAELTSVYAAPAASAWRSPRKGQVKSAPVPLFSTWTSDGAGGWSWTSPGKAPPPASTRKPQKLPPVRKLQGYSDDNRSHKSGYGGDAEMEAFAMVHSPSTWSLTESEFVSVSTGKARGLWEMSPPSLPTCEFAAKVYDRSRRTGPILDLAAWQRKMPVAPGPHPDVKRGTIGRVKRQEAILRKEESAANLQVGGSSASSAPGASDPPDGEEASKMPEKEPRGSLKAQPDVVSTTARRGSKEGGDQVDGGKSAPVEVVKTSPSRKRTSMLQEEQVTAAHDRPRLSSKDSKDVQIPRISRQVTQEESKAIAGGQEQALASPSRHRGSGGGQEDVGDKALDPPKSRDERSPDGSPKPQKDEDVWISIFKKLQDHNEIHNDDLPRALELSGFAAVQRKWVDDIFWGMSEYSTIEIDDYLRFMKMYQTKQHKEYEIAFRACDEDGSGFVESAELAELLRSFGIEPMSHVLQQAIEEVDEDGRGELDLEEFKNLMRMLVTREGFSRDEYENFVCIYQRFDRDGSGTCSTKELSSILNWLGYSVPADVVAQIAGEVDVDGSGEIDEREFLMCMRKVRERELKIVVKVMEESDADGSGTLSMTEVVDIVKGLGYDVMIMAAIEEAASDANVDSSEELGLSELWRVLAVFRTREGFTNEECNEIDDAFNEQDEDGSGELTSVEAPAALRELGYKVDFEAMQNVLSKVDVDDTGALDQVEFRKMVRMLQEKESDAFKQAFDAHVDGSEKIAQTAALEAAASLGYDMELQELFTVFELLQMQPSYPGAAVVRKDVFVRACFRQAREMREVFQRNGGWTDREVDDFRLIFDQYNVYGDGQITNKELMRLVEDMIPDMARDKNQRPKLLDLMRQVDTDGSGSLDFYDFLKLMQLFREHQDKERVLKEQVAIKDTGFTATEVAEFRELFLAADDSSGELSFQEFKTMVDGITPLGDALTQELEKIFYEVTDRSLGVDGNADEADFPEFLWLMKELLQRNFAGIKEKTSKFIK
eukprot:CAMPEP_0197627016 /NCGR_PEP_ID=MMETSP1338-20131121/5749_1 /TAXON_ID=43686 ORGANISM="Pelagodinium beii, Strain RCC1491" /NCGR_SAMPLE_ID=MMETSP1338 /ASSEMBLY_ACC=CAM_ASM_000754 /LENGTH=1038 /DNA_ID=CAMNT_0043197627 /DNA_START=1 /DNA_END=3117 /DNA_ORIENTATION=-